MKAQSRTARQKNELQGQDCSPSGGDHLTVFDLDRYGLENGIPRRATHTSARLDIKARSVKRADKIFPFADQRLA